MAHISGDEEMARQVQLTLEYSPNPPFSSGTPDESGSKTLTAVTEYFNSEGTDVRAELMAGAIGRYQKLQST